MNEENPLSRATVEEVMKKAGYTLVMFQEKKIMEIPEGQANAIESMVMDVWLEPAHLEGEVNFTAMSVAETIGLRYRELQQFGESICLRWARITG